MHVCLVDAAGQTLVHKNIQASRSSASAACRAARDLAARRSLTRFPTGSRSATF
jgi:hypothetical protein